MLRGAKTPGRAKPCRVTVQFATNHRAARSPFEGHAFKREIEPRCGRQGAPPISRLKLPAQRSVL
jgi:hypothetical protein